MILGNVLHENARVDAVVVNENVVLEALRTDVAVTSDVREANAENAIIKAQGHCRRRDGVSSKRSGMSKWPA